MSADLNSNPETRAPQSSQEPKSPHELAEARRQALLSWLLTAIAVGLFIYLRPGWAYTVGVFLLTLGVLIFVHEWGHYQFARWAGMKVNRFGIGFPPWIFTKERNGVKYSIGALPIGGMVDIAGLGSEEEMLATAKGAELTTSAPRPNVPHGQKLFQDASLGWRFWTLFAGPLMNLLFAVVAFIGVYSFVGLPQEVLSTRVKSVAVGEPAAQAGIRAGDRIVGVDGKRLSGSKSVGEAIRSQNGQPVKLLIERNGQTLSIAVKPIFKELPGLGRVPAIGIEFEPKIIGLTYTKTDVVTAIKYGFIKSAGVSLHILDIIRRALTRNLTREEVKDIGGPVKIAQAAGQVTQHGWAALVLFSGMLSVNLGLLNLLPFPALDGGRILFLGYELIMRRPLDPKKEGLVHMIGMAVLLAFMLFIIVRDIIGLSNTPPAG